MIVVDGCIKYILEDVGTHSSHFWAPFAASDPIRQEWLVYILYVVRFLNCFSIIVIKYEVWFKTIWCFCKN